MKIIITGNMGYVGSVLVGHLRKTMPSAEIYGYDSGFFAHSLTGASVAPEAFLDAQFFGDVRAFPPELLAGVDAVVHLAAISNDPMGNRFEQVTEDVNQTASLRIAGLAAAAGVKRFIFASSCSVYGVAEGDARREGDPLNPLTAYARSKVMTEQLLGEMDTGDMTVTCLRFATACGMSPRLRLDLVLNDFVANALSTGEIIVLSDGTPWRPLIDVEDMARALTWAISRTAENGGEYLSVNAGRDENNYQVHELAHAVAEHVPGAKVSINTSAPPDKRSYRVDFSLFKSLAASHIPQVPLSESVRRLVEGIRKTPAIDGNFRTSPFIRLKTLEGHLETGALSKDLRWVA
ncbi:NAD-dependent epimerase/dehydratase family protein [Rhizobium binxianense]